MVSLTDENRLLVSNGLKMIQQTDRLGGLNELLTVSGLKKRTVNETDIGFAVGPPPASMQLVGWKILILLFVC